MNFSETAESITLHGLGFVQVKLQGKQRLHVWHPTLPRRRCYLASAIHNHRFDFVSRVLVGVQINHDIEVIGSSAATHIAYLHEGERSQFGNRPWIPDGSVRVSDKGTRTIHPGADYTMKAFDFHWTEPAADGLVATIMTKGLEHTRGAHTLCEIEVEPDTEFDRHQWPEARLWTIVQEVLGHKPMERCK